VYSDNRLAMERQRSLLDHARHERQAGRLRALRRASRRAARAQDRLARAQSDIWRMRRELDAGW
jgi:hypothetical protein